MRLTFFALTLLASGAMAEDLEYSVSLMGSNAGTVRTSWNKADGSLASVADLNLAGQVISSKLTITVKDGKVVSSEISEKAGAVSGTVTYKDGKMTIVQNGKEVVKDRVIKADIRSVYSTYHPATVGLLYRDYVAKNRPAKLKTFSTNGLNAFEPDVSEAPITAETPKGPVAVSHFKLRVGGIDLVYAIDIDDRVLGFSVPAQQFLVVAKGYEGVFVDPLSKYPELSQPTYKVKTERRVVMKTRDGVILRSDIVRPDDENRHPTILIRTPYGRAIVVPAYEWLAKRGYVVVVQDVRGRGASDGEWDPLNKEVADGDDTLNWIAAQSWSDGGVGMIGGSYLGFVQWAAAVNQNPVLKCIIPQVSPPDPMHNLPWDHGCFMLTPGLWWSRIVMERQANMAAAGQGISDFKPFKTLPVSKVDDAMFKKNIPFFDLWLKRPRIEDWKGSFWMNQIDKVKIPVMHVSGTWDGDGIGTMLHWERLKKAGGNQWMVFGPWEHGFNMKTKFGDQDYGPTAVLELDSVYLRFFDTHLKGKDVKLDDQPRVRFFVTGSNKWAETSSWPPLNTTPRTLYLNGGKANGKASKGALATVPGKSKDTMIYDPLKLKVPEKGFDVDSSTTTTKVKRSEFREADLLYASEPFKEPTSITNLTANLFVSTSAKDANFHVSVFDEAPDGKLMVICQGGNGALSFLKGGGKAIRPNQVYQVDLKPWFFAHTFPKGHRLSIRVTNDLFPQFARNPGTGESLFTATKYVRSVNTVYKDAKRPSSVRFEVINY